MDGIEVLQGLLRVLRCPSMIFQCDVNLLEEVEDVDEVACYELPFLLQGSRLCNRGSVVASSFDTYLRRIQKAPAWKLSCTSPGLIYSRTYHCAETRRRPAMELTVSGCGCSGRTQGCA